MITINFKYNGDTITGQIPSTWQEMKVRHYLALESTTEPLKLLSLLTDIDLSFILNTSTDLTPYLNEIITLINKGVPELDKRPSKVITLRGKAVKIPASLDRITFGQAAIIEQHLSKHDQNEKAALAPIMATVLQPLLDNGLFDLDKAQALEAEILELPISKVFGNVFFFWQSLRKCMTFGQVGSLRYPAQTL